MKNPSPENESAGPVFVVRRNSVNVDDPGVFDAAWTAFEWLVTGPHPVALDCRRIPGLPAREVPLDELGTLLLATGCAQVTRDAVWSALITRSRAERSTWTVACVGLALPVLLPVAAKLTARYRGDAARFRDVVHDIHAAVLTGFLTGLTDVDLARPAILPRLRWAAYRAGRRAAQEEQQSTPHGEDAEFCAVVRHRPGGHPDFVLVAAVEAGVITADEAALIGETRFGDLTLAEAAHARGQTYKAAQRARHRAEQRLATHLSNDAAAEHGTAAVASPDDGATQLRVSVATPSNTPLRPVRRTGRDPLPRALGAGAAMPRPARQPRRRMSPHGPESGVSARGTHFLTRPPAHRPSRSAARPDSVQEAPSCD